MKMHTEESHDLHSRGRHACVAVCCSVCCSVFCSVSLIICVTQKSHMIYIHVAGMHVLQCVAVCVAVCCGMIFLIMCLT